MCGGARGQLDAARRRGFWRCSLEAQGQTVRSRPALSTCFSNQTPHDYCWGSLGTFHDRCFMGVLGRAHLALPAPAGAVGYHHGALSTHQSFPAIGRTLAPIERIQTDFQQGSPHKSHLFVQSPARQQAVPPAHRTMEIVCYGLFLRRTFQRGWQTSCSWIGRSPL